MGCGSVLPLSCFSVGVLYKNLYAAFTIRIFVSSSILCSSLFRALNEADAFLAENASLPITRQVSAYLDSQREDPANGEDDAQEKELDKSLPPFQPSGS